MKQNSTFGIARLLSVACAISVLILSVGCDNKRSASSSGQGQPETSFSGELSVYCDVEVADVFRKIAAKYHEVYPDATINIVPMSANAAFDSLTALKARCIAVGYNYLGENDTHPNAPVGTNALVLYTSKGFAYDTMNAEDVGKWIAGHMDDRTWTSKYPNMKSAPVFCVVDAQGSLPLNVAQSMLKGEPIDKKRLYAFPSRDSLLSYQRKNPAAIGIGYMSQFAIDTTVKQLRLSFIDSTNTYVSPKPVHLGYLAMNKYPYRAPIHVIIRGKISKNDLPSGFLAFASRDGRAQEIFLRASIQPVYAKLNLNLSE